MKTFDISAARPYQVLIAPGLLAEAGERLRALYPPRKCCIITDSNVNRLYAGQVSDSLRAGGFDVSKVVFPAGEHSKDIANYGNILEALADEGLTRSDLVVALGGGVVCDIAGFAAGTYLRGISYIMLPTTLLAAIDSSVGGATSLNLLGGKNLVGLLWQPSLVLCDPDTFSTQDAPRSLEGIAEAVKCAILSDAALIDRIKNGDREYVIDRCISIKKSLAGADESGTGLRQLLDFGHTIGHGIEKLSSYNVTHGQAIAKGMIAEAHAACAMGLSRADVSGDIRGLFASFGFDTSLNYDPEELYRYALVDSKIRDGQINLVVTDAIGRATLRKLPVSRLREFTGLAVEA